MGSLGHLKTYRLLLGVSLFFTMFGVVTAIAPMLPPASLWGRWIGAQMFGGPMPPGPSRLYTFMLGPLGGTMAALYVLQTALVWVPVRRGEAWASVAILAATTLWFAIDSVVSARHGAWFNIWRINLPAYVLTCGAVAALRWESGGGAEPGTRTATRSGRPEPR